MLYPKPKMKKTNRKQFHDFSPKVKQKEYEDAKGICRICHKEPITQYHHANEKGMGGGRGLGIQLNCIGTCDTCHNHSNTDFLHKSSEILLRRIYNTFPFSDFAVYEHKFIANKLEMSVDEVIRQIQKGFLQTDPAAKGYVCDIDDIKRWLGVSA